ncbi:hypothetical protein ACUNFA_10330, partial [Serratia sp. IR-2025]
MSLDTSPVPELSGQQRRCHLLLMLYTPEPELQLETLSRITGGGGGAGGRRARPAAAGSAAAGPRPTERARAPAQ